MKQCKNCASWMEDNVPVCVRCGAPFDVVNDANDSFSQNRVAQQTYGSNPEGYLMHSNDGFSSLQDNNEIIKKESNKKKIDKKIIVMVVICAISVLFGILGIIVAIVSNSNSDRIVARYGSNVDSNVNELYASTKIAYDGYEFVIPKDYDYEIVDRNEKQSLLVSDDNSYVAIIDYDGDNTFESIKNNANTVSDNLATELGFSVTVGSKVIDDLEFVYFDFGERIGGGRNAVLAISAIDLGCFETLVVTKSGVDGTQYLKNIAGVIKSARKGSTVNRSFMGDGFDTITIPSINTNKVPGTSDTELPVSDTEEPKS